MDSFLKVTRADGKIIAMNDDHFDAASGLNTDHSDSYLMVKLHGDGKYFIHIGDTRHRRERSMPTASGSATRKRISCCAWFLPESRSPAKGLPQ